jgi:hypothetical protein
MREPIGRTVPLSPTRRFVIDLVTQASQIPTIPVGRVFDVAALEPSRRAHPARPSWSVLFMKAFALVAVEHPALRRAYLKYPVARLYEHPQSIASLAIEREYQGEPGIFVGMFRAPESQSLVQLQTALELYKTLPTDQVGVYRQMLRISRLPGPARRFLWWTTLNFSGFKRAKRLGTFGVTSYGSLGAESLHPISPLAVTLTYGPIDAQGRVMVKLVYDHRVMDGAFVARRLRDVEDTLHAAILRELTEDLERPQEELASGLPLTFAHDPASLPTPHLALPTPCDKTTPANESPTPRITRLNPKTNEYLNRAAGR